MRWRKAALPAVAASIVATMLCACADRAPIVLAPVGPVVLSAANASRVLQRSPIKHVVVVIQENRSFDNLFNGYRGADTVQSGVMSTGKTVQLQPVGLESPVDLTHSHKNWYTQYAGGKMYFDLGSPGAPIQPYSYVPASETKLYRTLAHEYTLADKMFQSNTGPSFVAHMYLTAATSRFPDGKYGADNPYNQFGPIATNANWGCDDPPGSFEPILGPNGVDPAGPFPCFDNKTLADELTAQNQTWRYYAPQVGTEGSVFSVYDAFRQIRFGKGWSNVITPETRFLQDAARGELPAVTWVTPTMKNSDHSGTLSKTGPQWIASVVNAVGNSPNWSSTAILIIWDDWGGWFDHVQPPQLDAMGLGFRVPMLVVSPYAKHDYVSHVQHEFGSILHFTEKTFGLPTLAESDARADDLSDCFDYSQKVKPYQPLPVERSPDSFAHAPEMQPPDND